MKNKIIKNNKTFNSIGAFSNNHILYNDDCNNVMDEMISKNIKVDLIITDPPYDIKNTKTGGESYLNKSFQKSQDELTKFNLTKGFDYETILNKMVKLQDKINMYIWCNKSQIPFYLDYFVIKMGCNFDIIKWVKTNPMPTYHNKYMTDTEYCIYVRKGGYCNPENYQDGSTLFQAPINTKDKKLYKHPTIKPENIIDRLVRNSSKENETIFDPFMGSGTTGVSALKHNRKFIGVELLKEFYNISKNRIVNSNNLDYKSLDTKLVS